MSGRRDREDELERYEGGGRDRRIARDSGDGRGRPRRAKSGGRPAEGRRERSPASGTLVEELAGSLEGTAATVETATAVATLVGVPRVDLREFAYAHQIDGSERVTRSVALFDLENTGDRPLCWRTERTKFIGDDDYSYRRAHLSLDPSSLGPGCHTRRVEIEPGRRARVVTPVERMPPDTEVAEVVHRFSAHRHGEDERLSFSVA